MKRISSNGAARSTSGFSLQDVRRFLPGRRIFISILMLALTCQLENVSISEPTASASTVTTVQYRPDSSTPVSSGALNRTAEILQIRARALGAKTATAKVSNGTIDLSLPTAEATPSLLKTVQATSTLFFRPAICGAPAYKASDSHSSTNGTYLAPPTCTGAYRYPAQTVRSVGTAYVTPNPEP